MSIDEQLRHNLHLLNLRPEFQGRLIPASEEQKHLTRTHILPHIDSLSAEIRLLRKEVDIEFIQNATKIEEHYPYGQCKSIRDAMVTRMKEDMEEGKLIPLRAFVYAGGIIQPFWGIDKGIYFQNAIQIGTTILDVANDTVDPQKEPVVWYPDLETAPIRRIESFEEYASVAESYWKCEIFPNVYFPAIAPVFPMLALKKAKGPNGGEAMVLTLETGAADLHLKNLYSINTGGLFGLASHFLLQSKYAPKRLPEDLLKQLQQPSESLRAIFDAFILEDASRPVPPSLLHAAEKMKGEGLKLENAILARRLP